MSLKTAVTKISQINLSDLAEEVIIQFSPELIEINTDQQLYAKGIDSLGRSLKEYADLTKTIKQKKGQPYDRTTLNDTDDFYNGFELDSDKFPFGVTSSDKKTQGLTEKYGEEIFGLTNENERDYIKTYIEPEFLDRAEEEMLDSIKIL